ncbi:isoprenylcysteine carboxylmethyltransferase family protein [Starkeya sp. ORNL1]|uniref:methyltransferase family protein n=1 Tax=Starkeya sp. ORNL1 TaxID=2709380 RepID=UPI001464A370|nr:isoprenylcysteine carboxylmethyltransferase family protein [Starkeya sp. ORNL1]QJP15411.1 isoprenylcysteine carboxylmethyltransferase family protein [Starkeya sp. ORNL1]
MSKPRLALLTIVSTLAYLALPILGWGGIAPFFAGPARIALTLVLFVFALAALFTQGNLSTGVREDRSNRWVLATFGVLGLLAGWIPAYMDRLDVWTLDGDTMRWFGVLLFAVGGALRLSPVFVLGHRFSGLVAIQPGHRLVTGGIYGVIRHPSYLGFLIGSLGWALAFRSIAGVVLVVLMIVPIIGRIRAEESLLRSEFGTAYDAYRARTSRLIPGLY